MTILKNEDRCPNVFLLLEVSSLGQAKFSKVLILPRVSNEDG